MDKRFLIAGSFFGLLAVVVGAFGTHGLQQSLDVSQIATFETGVKYQMYHALLLLFLGLIPHDGSKLKTLIFWFLVIGIVLFSWSIYGLATNPLTPFDFKKVAILTPIGGGLLIISWVVLLIKALTLKKQ